MAQKNFAYQLKEDVTTWLNPRHKPRARVFDLAQTGGAEGIRTPDLINAIDALSQLSYSPTDNNHNPTNRNTSYFNPLKTPIRSFPAPVSVIWASLVRAPLRFAKGASRSSPVPYKWSPLSFQTFPPRAGEIQRPTPPLGCRFIGDDGAFARMGLNACG